MSGATLLLILYAASRTTYTAQEISESLWRSPVVDIGLSDYQHDLRHDAVQIPRTKEFFTNLKQPENMETTFVPRVRVRRRVRLLKGGNTNIQYGVNNIQYGGNNIQYGHNNIQYGSNNIQYGNNNRQDGQHNIQYGTNNIQLGRHNIQYGTNHYQDGQNRIQYEGNGNQYGGRRRRRSVTEDIYLSRGLNDSSNDAVYLKVEKNVRTTAEDHLQDVRLITLSSANPLQYNPGDIFTFRPRNCQDDVDDLFRIFNEHGLDIKPMYQVLVEEMDEDMPVPLFLQTPLTVHRIAEQYWDLKAYPTQYVFSLLANVSEDKLEKDKCIELSSPEGQEDWLNYSRRSKRTILEVLRDFPKTTSKLTISDLFELFSTIKPRSFAIASSNLQSPNSLDLMVDVVEYRTKLQMPRKGLGSNWLKGLTKEDGVYGWIKEGSFVFPEDMSTPLILITPGTALAPTMRSIIQQRYHLNTLSNDTVHLIYGCRYRNKHFYFKEELEKMVQEGKLSLYCAFSRDQRDKIYVQHKISENSSSLWDLIHDKNAYIYISGNAKNMLDNVKEAFIEDLFKYDEMTKIDDEKEFLKMMENEGRLQIEAW